MSSSPEVVSAVQTLNTALNDIQGITSWRYGYYASHKIPTFRDEISASFYAVVDAIGGELPALLDQREPDQTKIDAILTSHGVDVFRMKNATTLFSIATYRSVYRDLQKKIDDPGVDQARASQNFIESAEQLRKEVLPFIKDGLPADAAEEVKRIDLGYARGLWNTQPNRIWPALYLKKFAKIYTPAVVAAAVNLPVQQFEVALREKIAQALKGCVSVLRKAENSDIREEFIGLVKEQLSVLGGLDKSGLSQDERSYLKSTGKFGGVGSLFSGAVNGVLQSIGWRQTPPASCRSFGL